MRHLLITVFALMILGSINCGQPNTTTTEKGIETSPHDGVTTTEPQKESPTTTELQKELPKTTESQGREPSQESSQEQGVSQEDPVDAAVTPEPAEKHTGQESAPEPTPEPMPESTPERPLSDTNPSWLAKVTCQTPPPPGATLAPKPPAYSGGTCPTLKAGLNTFMSKGKQRKFLLILPSNPKSGEIYPVLFMWHWLKANAGKFLKQGDVQKSVDQQRFIAIIPEAKGDLNMLVTKVPWPFLKSVPQARYEEEFVFFDDMLSCVSQQFKVNKECVSTVGVSAGALFAAQLVGGRSQYLSSFLSLSGGVDESAGIVARVRSWKSTKRKLPALVLWGGPQDSCVLLNFEKASKKLEQSLAKDGHFFIECVHNCKHAEPPITARPGKSRYESLWDFFLRHPYWLNKGESPFKVTPWPYTNVPWCGVGAGSAKPRTGSCPPPACPI